ncbi:unnamed protein product [Amaranthus hypochondriacus]
MADTDRIARLFNENLNSNGQVVRNATQQLDHLFISSNFPFSLLSLINGRAGAARKDRERSGFMQSTGFSVSNSGYCWVM